MLGWSILKAFADDKQNSSEIMRFVSEKKRSIIGKGNKNPAFFFFFSKAFTSSSPKSGFVSKTGYRPMSHNTGEF